MGLPCQVTDFSTESIYFFSTMVTTFFYYLHSKIHSILESLGFPFKQQDHDHDHDVQHEDDVVINDPPAAALGGLNLLLAEQYLSLNRLSSEVYGFSDDGEPPAAGGGSDLAECIVCLSCLREGDQVRRLLECGHVFHKKCFDGWLEHLNFNCPLCRTPLVSEECVAAAEAELAEYEAN